MKKIIFTILISISCFFVKSQTTFASLFVGSSNPISIADGSIAPQTLADAQTLEIHATKLNVGEKNNQTYNTTQNTARLNVASTFDGTEIVRFRTLYNTSYFDMYSVLNGKIQSSFIQEGLPQLFLSANTNNSIGVGNNNPNINAKLDVTGNIFSSGKIAIGTTDMTKIGTNSLAVNGTAVFTKAKVAIYGSGWPDYVFSTFYKLTSLDSLEEFIHLNHHLPEVPSSDEVEKNGIDLGDNQALLLKKIEELTLIAIGQNKKIEEQSKQIVEMEMNIKTLQLNSKL